MNTAKDKNNMELNACVNYAFYSYKITIKVVTWYIKNQ